MSLLVLYEVYDDNKPTGQIVGEYEFNQGEQYLTFLTEKRGFEKPSLKRIPENYFENKRYKAACLAAAKNF